MQTLQPRATAIKPNKPLAEVGTAQHAALLRWFSRVPVQDVCDALLANTRFPLVSCNDQAHAFAPDRGTPRSVA